MPDMHLYSQFFLQSLSIYFSINFDFSSNKQDSFINLKLLSFSFFIIE